MLLVAGELWQNGWTIEMPIGKNFRRPQIFSLEISGPKVVLLCKFSIRPRGVVIKAKQHWRDVGRAASRCNSSRDGAVNMLFVNVTMLLCLTHVLYLFSIVDVVLDTIKGLSSSVCFCVM